MSTFKIKALYPHLSQEAIDEMVKFHENYNYDNDTDSDRLLSKKLNDEADMLQPVMSSGWRCTDIDSIDQIQDIRAQNILLSRLKPMGPQSENDLTDEELIENVIPRNLTSTYVQDMASEYTELKARSLALLAEQNASSADTPIETATE